MITFLWISTLEYQYWFISDDDDMVKSGVRCDRSTAIDEGFPRLDFQLKPMEEAPYLTFRWLSIGVEDVFRTYLHE